jgi:hypothetical protein
MAAMAAPAATERRGGQGYLICCHARCRQPIRQRSQPRLKGRLDIVKRRHSHPKPDPAVAWPDFEHRSPIKREQCSKNGGTCNPRY